VISAGSRILLLTSVPADRYSAGFLVDTLIGPREDVVRAALGSLAVPVLRQPSGPSDAIAPGKGGPCASDACRPDNERGAAMSRSMRYARCVMEAARGEHQWLLLDAKRLEALPDDERRRILDLTRDKITVVASTNPAAAARLAPDLVAVADQRAIVGLGPAEWLEAHRREVDAILPTAAGASRDADDDDDTAMDEDDF
jgi:hypothetical protein